MANLERKNFILRTVSGVVVVSGILVGIQQGGWMWVLVVSILALLSMAEYYRLL